MVTSNVFLDEGIVFNQVNDDWIKFCTETLNFSVPGLGLKRSQAEPQPKPHH